MIITNKHQLPEPLIQAITYDLTPREGFSVTDLISPPRITQLSRRHWDEIKMDATERIWVLLGSAIHYILAHAMEDADTEKVLTADIDGTTVSGRPDIRYNGVIDDYKVTSVWNIVFQPEGREEYHAQLNSYNYLNYRATNELATKLRIWSILRDWQGSKVGEDKYPAIPIIGINIPVWPLEKVEAYLRERVRLHRQAEGLLDRELPMCTPDEMWEKPTTYALMKAGRKTAIRVFTEYEKAKQRLLGLDKHHYIVERPGSRARCQRFCEVKGWCKQ